MKKYFTLFSALFVLIIGCVRVDDKTLANRQGSVSNFSQIAANENKMVVILGFLSKTHGASGMYFNLEDLNNENEKCVTLTPFLQRDHGEQIIVQGKLVSSKCQTEQFCLNTCSDYNFYLFPIR